MYNLLRSLVDPLTLCFLLLALVLASTWWRNPESRKRLKWLVIAFVFSWIACTSLCGFLAAGALEWHYPAMAELPENADAIVLLSGGARSANDFVPYATPACDTLRRTRLAARLYHQRPCPILACGGNAGDLDDGDSLAAIMREDLLMMGVNSKHILQEGDSTNTYLNAELARPVLEQHGLRRVVLVTDATHLPRATRCFEKHGFEVILAGAHYRASRFRPHLTSVLPNSHGAYTNMVVLHEVVGLLWYKLRGRI